MNADAFREQFRYNRWANRQLVDLLDGLDAELYSRDLGSSFPSIRDTLVHLLSSEWLWAERWKGHSPQRRLDPADFPRLAEVRARWAEVERDQDAYLTGLADDDLERPFAYLNPKGERWEYRTWHCLTQCWTHSLYHRAQIVTMLRQLGELPVETDYLTFYDVGGGDAPKAHG